MSSDEHLKAPIFWTTPGISLDVTEGFLISNVAYEAKPPRLRPAVIGQVGMSHYDVLLIQRY